MTTKIFVCDHDKAAYTLEALLKWTDENAVGIPSHEFERLEVILDRMNQGETFQVRGRKFTCMMLRSSKNEITL